MIKPQSLVQWQTDLGPPQSARTQCGREGREQQRAWLLQLLVFRLIPNMKRESPSALNPKIHTDWI